MPTFANARPASNVDRYQHDTATGAHNACNRVGRVNRALPFLSREIRSIATDGVPQPGALPVGWTAREPWLGAARYTATGPINALAPELPPAPAAAVVVVVAPVVEVVEDLTLRAVASLPVEAYAAPPRRWARAFGVNTGHRFVVLAPVAPFADDEPIDFGLDAMVGRDGRAAA